VIQWINNHFAEFNIRLKFSTLDDYFVARHNASAHGVAFSFEDRDFMPYADNEESYWTGKHWFLK
jgi:hypothetical protein